MRTARIPDKAKIHKLQGCIDDPQYLNTAVELLAEQMILKLVHNDKHAGSYLSARSSKNLLAEVLKVAE